MAAGLGFKTFTTGEVLTAADTNGYLMQGILVFADATARDAAITAPEEGQFAYLKDTNVTTYYTGSAWANVDTTGMTNPMTTTGDVIYSSSGSTPAALGIGTVGQVLTVNSGATAPEWAAPAAGGGKVLQVVQGSTSTPVSNSTNVYADTGVTASITPSAATSKVLILVTHNNNGKTAGDVNNVMRLRLFRGATAIDTITTVNWDGQANPVTISSASFTYLDSPNTTSAITYKTQFMNQNNTAAVSVQNDQGGAWTGTKSFITLIEIGA
jgi:hypothetical protein